MLIFVRPSVCPTFIRMVKLHIIRNVMTTDHPPCTFFVNHLIVIDTYWTHVHQSLAHILNLMFPILIMAHVIDSMTLTHS